MNIFIDAFVFIFFLQIFFFVFAAIFKTDKLTDMSYGLTFVFTAIFLYIGGKQNSNVYLLVTFLIISWGVRLAGYLFIRILKIKKDKRFDGIRENFLKFASFWLLQAISIWIIMLPVFSLYSINTQNNNQLFSLIGSLLFLTGLSIETIADMQKYKFKNNPENHGKWIDKGLWKYSRHPNYFGEMLCWWSLFFIISPFLNGFYWLSILGPIHISILLLFVSGIPTLEKKYNQIYKENKNYIQYRNKTNLLVPLPMKIF
jgi:steroid 5-alpha reductase family enzyme